MPEKYCVRLSKEERQYLLKLVSSGNTSARRMVRARILLKADRGPDGPAWSDKAISKAFDVSLSTVWRVRKRYVEDGLEEALNQRKPQRIYKRKLDSEKKALLMALIKSHPPNGHRRWTLRLIASETVQMGLVDSISHEAIRLILREKQSFDKGERSSIDV